MKLFYLFIIVFSFTACKTKNRNAAKTGGIEGTWSLSNYTSNDGSDINSVITGKKPTHGDLVKLGVIISFFADQSYTRVVGNGDYTTGRWKFTPETNNLTLIPSGENPVQLSTISQTFDKNATLSLTNNKENSTMFLIRSALPIEDFKEDPYYQGNNTWRIRSTKKDSAAAIKEKLVNLIQHYIYVLKAAKERSSRVVSFEYSKSLISIYNGGIGVLPREDVDPIWVKTFYNEADAMKAYEMYNRTLSRTSFKGEPVGNWIEDDYNILLAILTALKQGSGNL